MSPKRALTGIKPTGTPHLGNLLGAIRPALELSKQYDAYYFIADYHALTTVHNGDEMRKNVLSVAATFMALGLDTNKATLFQQSAVPEVTELSYILSCMTGLGHMERAHAYKASLARGTEINVGTFTYPILMAADILLYGSNFVPVGQDQKQHVEMAKDIAQMFNSRFGPVLTLPEASIQKDVSVVVGLDGQKMSKSYGNTIPLFLPTKQLKALVGLIKTDSTPLDSPKDPDTCNVYALYRLFATPEEASDVASKYRAGGYGYGHAKAALLDALERELGPARERYTHLMAHPEEVDAVLKVGAAKARVAALTTLAVVRERCGFANP